jgi:hypothetical protein
VRLQAAAAMMLFSGVGPAHQLFQGGRRWALQAQLSF